MRRVLMLSPHFPPDSTAATHRVRLLAPHLPEYGWEPIVVTAEPDGYEGRLDADLAALVPPGLRVVRCHAWSPSWTRRLGIGDLGLRLLVPALRTCAALVKRERVDAVFITTYPIYTAAIGPMLKRAYGVPYVIDLQDPWVGAWGRDVGGGQNGAPDAKSRLTRKVAGCLERPVLGKAAAITAVSARTYEDVFERWPMLRDRPSAAIPIGVEPSDFERVAAGARTTRPFDNADGLVHVCSVGTILPMGMDVVGAVLNALADLRRRRPHVAGRLRLHFFGTSNERSAAPADRVRPLATAAGVGDLVTEHAARVDYLEAVRIQQDAQALLLVGSTEPHYTASRLYPALVAGRPLLAVYHDASSVVEILRRETRPPTVRVISFTDCEPVGAKLKEIAAGLQALGESPLYAAADVSERAIAEFSARTLAGRLADVLNRVARA
jgi:glycosyltransferase involved in cell wall biosynthesis